MFRIFFIKNVGNKKELNKNAHEMVLYSSC